MDLLNFVNTYWTVLAGIGSFVWVIIYLQMKARELEEKMKIQKDEHDVQLKSLETKHASLESKVEVFKDKLGDAINFIQQDIREIMTIIKQK